MPDQQSTIPAAVDAAKKGRLRSFLAARLDPKAYLGLHLTVGLAVAAAGLWIFSALLDAVLDNATLVQFDVFADAWIHDHGTAIGVRAFLFLTQLGSPIAMIALGIVVAIFLWVKKRKTLLIGWAAAFIGGTLVDQVLKRVVHRARPAYGTQYLHGNSYSFPSGHAMGSIIGYGMLVWVIWQFWHPGKAVRWLVVALATLIVLGIGMSRVYLGVHYPSDVWGGWAAGAAWMAVCITGVNIARKRHIDIAHPVAAAQVEHAKAQVKEQKQTDKTGKQS